MRGGNLSRVPGVENIIEKLAKEKKTYGEVSEKGKEMNNCVICTEDFTAESEVSELACDERHIFHTACISEWMKRQTVCPLCKKEVTVKD